MGMGLYRVLLWIGVRLVLVGSMAMAAALTSTTCVTSPGSITRMTGVRTLMRTSTSLASAVLNPATSARMVHRPGITPPKSATPRSSVVTVREPMPEVIVTLAPGITAPVASSTVTSTLPTVTWPPWAQADTVVNRRHTNSKSTERDFIRLSPRNKSRVMTSSPSGGYAIPLPVIDPNKNTLYVVFATAYNVSTASLLI